MTHRTEKQYRGTAPLEEFRTTRAAHSLWDRSYWRWYDKFLKEEGRAFRRTLDIPNPADAEGHNELLRLVDRIIERDHTVTALAALSSMEVDLDWYKIVLRETGWEEARLQIQRLTEQIERLTASIADSAGAEQLLHNPILSPIQVATKSASAQLAAFLARHPEEVHHLKPRQFESLIAEIFSGFGWDVELTAETRDGGYDLLAVSNDVDGSGMRASYVIECKKYSRAAKVGVSAVRQLLAVKDELRAAHAILVTTSDFTQGVYQFQADRLDFDARNLEAVIEWCRQYSNKHFPLPKGLFEG